MTNAIKPKKTLVAAYLIIPVAIFVFSVFIPLMAAAYFSFFEWKGGPHKDFIGLENYVTLIKDQIFFQSLGHNVYLVIACIIGQIGLAFVIVMFLNSKYVKFKGIHRTFGFFPSTIAAVSIGFIWTMVYDYRRGIINWFLELIGRDDLAKVWLNEPSLVMLLIAIPLIWQFIGYYMVIIMSAISSIDGEIMEAADIDGASGLQRSLYVVLPMIKNTLLVCVTLCVAGNMKAFDHIFVMTTGGPGNSSMVMALYGYKISFTQQNMGYGSAISIGIFIASLSIIAIFQFLVNFLSKNRGEGALDE